MENNEVIKVRVAAMTHFGKVRSHNEDCIGINEWVRSSTMISPIYIECQLDENKIFVIADGLGGHSGGEVASALAVKELTSSISGLTGQGPLNNSLRLINKRIYDLMERMPQYAGMGTTVVGLAIIGNEIIVFNIGDSRAYIGIGNYLRMISIDDAFASSGASSSDKTGQHSHAILQSLGGANAFREIEPHFHIEQLEKGKRFLLCSDGLTDMLDQDVIEACIEKDVMKSTENLVMSALAAGGKDNISVIMIDIS